MRYGVENWIPTYLQTAKGFSFNQSSLGWILYELSGIVGTIACGWISDRWFKGKRAPATILFMGLTVVAVVAYWFNAKGPLWIDYVALSAIGALIYGPIMLIGLQSLDLVPKKAAGTAAGFTGFFGYAFGSAIAGSGVGWIADRWGWSGVFTTMVICCLLTIFFSALTLGHRAQSAARDVAGPGAGHAMNVPPGSRAHSSRAQGTRPCCAGMTDGCCRARRLGQLLRDRRVSGSRTDGHHVRGHCTHPRSAQRAADRGAGLPVADDRALWRCAGALAAYLSMPHQRLLTLSVGFIAGGVAGIVYGLFTAVNLRRQSHGGDYVPVREDWIWNVILPTFVYAGLTLAGCLIWRETPQVLFAVALLSLLLLFIGIRNSWDIAVWMTTHPPDRRG